MPDVSQITIRRDIAELATSGALQRTRGGAMLPEAKILTHPSVNRMTERQEEQELRHLIDDLDAIVLPPVSGRGGDALRRQIRKRNIPFLAESAPQEGGVYLGPDNFQASFELGKLAAEHAIGRLELTVLSITHADLTNTRQRTEGFEQGLRSSYKGKVNLIRADGQGNYRSALRVANDAFEVHQTIDIVFGVNDHSAMAGRDAASMLGRSVSIYATGGERSDFVGELVDNGPLKAIAAYFPEIVGAIAINSISSTFAGQSQPKNVLTPFAIITSDNIADYYEKTGNTGRKLRQSVIEGFAPKLDGQREAGKRGITIGFMPHFPAHDWYRTMISAMQQRADHYGYSLAVTPHHQGIANEIERLQDQIAETAISAIAPGETIIIGEGAATLKLATALTRLALLEAGKYNQLTVITNSLDILHQLESASAIKTILTSGEYQAKDRCLVGPSLAALFERMRADKAFISASGVSPTFGASTIDERRALAGSRFVGAAQSTIILADSTKIGLDANHRICRIGEIDRVITDDGSLPIDRQALRSAGIDVVVSGETENDPTTPPPVLAAVTC